MMIYNDCCTPYGCDIQCITTKAEKDTKEYTENECVTGNEPGCYKPNFIWPITGYTGHNYHPNNKPKSQGVFMSLMKSKPPPNPVEDLIN